MTFEERVEALCALGYQLISLQQFTQQSSFRPPARWRIVLHKPPGLIFSYGWGETFSAALDDSLTDFKKQEAWQARMPTKPQELSLDDLDL